MKQSYLWRIATMLSVWALIYYALTLKRVYGGTWGETIGRGALLTMLLLVLPQTVCLE